MDGPDIINICIYRFYPLHINLHPAAWISMKINVQRIFRLSYDSILCLLGLSASKINIINIGNDHKSPTLSFLQ